MSGNHPNRIACVRAATVIAVSLAALLLIVAQGPALADRAGLNAPDASTAIASYLYHFNPATQAFVTITLPAGTIPSDVEVTGTVPAYVWLTDNAANRLIRLIYTDTTDYALTAYPITTTPDSGPYRLALNGSYAWFTQRDANRVGRLNAITGQLDEFFNNGLPASAGLSDIKVAPNGQVWLGADKAQRLIRLIVTNTLSYSFTAFTPLGTAIAPYALAVEEGLSPGSYSVHFTSPTLNAYKAWRFMPAAGTYVLLTGFPANSQPWDMTIASGKAWYADPGLNALDRVELGTWSIVNTFSVTQPRAVAAVQANVVWLTQAAPAGTLGQLQVTSATSSTLTIWALPRPQVLPTGLAVALNGRVWVAGYQPIRLYLPIGRR